MKKLLIGFLLIVLLGTAASYLFIPSEIRISTARLAKCLPKNVVDCLLQTAAWQKWWPGSNQDKKGFIMQDYSYQLTKRLVNGAEIALRQKNKVYVSQLIVLPFNQDSALLQWQLNYHTSFNPLTRLFQYLQAFRIRDNMNTVLASLARFAGQTINIYGFAIERTTFTDTVLVTTKFLNNTYPSNTTIYAAIDKLKRKMVAQGATEINYPLLNITQKGDAYFETMIAICADKEIKGDGTFFIKRMIPMKDRFLTTEVQGGPLTIRNAHQAINQYMNDHFLSAPAIPFEALITDRSKETDTTKWKTRIFYPSM